MNDKKRTNTTSLTSSNRESVTIRALFYFAIAQGFLLLAMPPAISAANVDEPSVATNEYEPDWRVEIERFPDFDGNFNGGLSNYFQRIERDTDLAVAPDGSIYQLCNIDRGNDRTEHRDILLVKFNAKGERVWFKTIGKKGHNEEGECVGVDHRGNVYVAGLLRGKAFVSSYSPSGGHLWSHTEKDVSLYTAMTFSEDSVYLTGLSTVRISPDAPRRTSKGDMLVSRFKLDGRKIWSKQFQGDTKNYMWGLGIAVFENKRVYVAGIHIKPDLNHPGLGAVSDENIILLCLDATGKRLWGREIGREPNLRNRDTRGDVEIGVGVVVDSEGSVYVAGNSTAPLDPDLPDDEDRHMPTLLKYTSKGEKVWARQIAAPWNRIRMMRAIITKEDRILIAGTIRTRTPRMLSMALIEYDVDGNLLHILRSEKNGISAEGVHLAPGSKSIGGNEADRVLIAGKALRNKRAPDLDNRPQYYFLMQVDWFDNPTDDEPGTTPND